MTRPLRQSPKLAGPRRTPLAALSARELQILALVAAGERSRTVADALEIAVPTVKSHLRTIYHKLGVRNRVQATNIYYHGQPTGPTPQHPPHPVSSADSRPRRAARGR